MSSDYLSDSETLCMTREQARAKLMAMHPDMWTEDGALTPEWGGPKEESDGST